MFFRKPTVRTIAAIVWIGLQTAAVAADAVVVDGTEVLVNHDLTVVGVMNGGVALPSAPTNITSGRSLNGADLGLWHVIETSSGDYQLDLPATADHVGRFVGFEVASPIDPTNAVTVTIAAASGEDVGGDAGVGLIAGNRLVLRAQSGGWRVVTRELDTQWVHAGPVEFTGSITDPVKGTIQADAVHWRRCGDSMQIRFALRFTGGAQGDGAYRFGIPAGRQVDLGSALAHGGTAYGEAVSATVGSGSMAHINSLSDWRGTGSVFVVDADALGLFGVAYHPSTGGNASGVVGKSFFAAQNVSYSGSCTVPIAGW